MGRKEGAGTTPIAYPVPAGSPRYPSLGPRRCVFCDRAADIPRLSWSQDFEAQINTRDFGHCALLGVDLAQVPPAVDGREAYQLH